MLIFLKNIINKFLSFFGFRISKINTTDDLVKIYKYKNHEEYKKTQIFFNKKKLHHVWADGESLKILCDFINTNVKKNNVKGLCHGSRNGFEQEFFNNNIKNSEGIGTDISETATNFKNSVIWDFHEINEKWIKNFDFIYTNSLDQSYDPNLALSTWLEQINDNGYIIIEHSDQHGVRSSGKMDPFGVEANFFPYLLSNSHSSNLTFTLVPLGISSSMNILSWFLS